MKIRWLFIFDLLEMSARRFYRDKLPQRANAIAYSLLISIVPLLTIAMRFTNVNREEIRFQLLSFFQLYGITGADPVINALDDILGRSNAIAGIGLLFMIYAAMNIFKYLEETANHVFRVKPRPLLIRNSIFTSWLVVIPFIIVIGGSALSDIQKSYSHPAIIDIRIDRQRLYTLKEGHKLTISDLSTNENPVRQIHYLHKTDFQVPGRNISPEVEQKDESLQSSSLSWKDGLGPPQKLYIFGDRIYIIAKPNFLFFSLDAGQSWDYRIFQSSYDRGISIPRIEAFRPESNRLLLLLSSPRGSRLLILHPERIDLFANQSYRETYRSLFFLAKKQLYIMATRGSVIESSNGFQWSEPKLTTALAESMVDLIERPRRDGWLARTSIGRIVILDNELQSTFPPVHLPTASTISGLRQDSTGRIYIWTRTGEVRMSLDEGESFIRTDLQRPETSLLTIL
ncbi:MAG: YihY/virulence factor BrkB family protein, partial [Leptonema sp. (in: Bacteria)]|nr:YihY/virulence factor BrkB family protein [Leptonema sp. (in: bacteria)]